MTRTPTAAGRTQLYSMLCVFFGVLFMPVIAWGDVSIPEEMILKTDWRIWQVDLRYQDLFSNYEKTFYKGIPIKVDDGALAELGDAVEHRKIRGLDVMKIQAYLEKKITPAIFREREDVKIDLNVDGNPVFEGSGLYGRRLDTRKASFMIKDAIENEVTYVNLPIILDNPRVTVHKKLKEKGVQELVSAGETDFKGSPPNRINNIQTGLSKFNGHLVPPGEKFTFGETLGEVEEYTGYKRELVILGDRTVPEYGGGLCQVSTTAYRAVLAGGFPVTKRRNHSYAVSYYAPIGLDATVYPPQVDMQFINDSPAYLLMQSFTRDGKAYYNFYGTKDDRKVYMIGPYYYGRSNPPPPRTEYTSKLEPGEKEVLGHAVPGVSSKWYREVTYGDVKKDTYFETIQSTYQARPDFIAIGAEEGRETPAERSMIETTY